MRALVTGSTGFIGHHLVAHLTACGDEVIPLARTFDIQDRSSIGKVFREAAPDVVYHLAAIAGVDAGDTGAVFDTNVTGTINIALATLACAKPPLVVFASTAAVYGAGPGDRGCREDDPIVPMSPYGTSKAVAEMILASFARSDGLRAVAARIFNCVGTNQRPSFLLPAIARQVVAIAAGAPAVIRVGAVDAARDFINVEDVVHALRLLATVETNGECPALNIGMGQSVTIGEIVQRMCALGGVSPEIVERGLRPGDPVSVYADTARISALTGWAPRLDLEVALRSALAEAARSA